MTPLTTPASRKAPAVAASTGNESKSARLSRKKPGLAAEADHARNPPRRQCGRPQRGFRLLPDIPTLDEAGVKGFESGTWNALAAPPKTPPAIIAKLNKG